MAFGESQTKLTYAQGQFFLENPGYSQKQSIYKNSYWVKAGSSLYYTTNLKAAGAFESFGDEQSKRIFQKAFVRFYETPRLPQLSFADPHQLDGIRWILSRSRSYLAHPPGAGKTMQAIMAAIFNTYKIRQSLFIVPPSLTVNWEREIMKFFSMVVEKDYPAIGTVPPSPRQDEMAWRSDFIICPDSMLTKPWVYERLTKMKFNVIAVDEASRFKESTADRSIALYGGRIVKDRKGKYYPGLINNAKHIVFMDGSPMPNRPMELWAPTYALNPEAIDCMDQRDFGFKYCGATQNDRGEWEFLQSSREAELKEKLQKDFMHVVPESILKHPERLRSLLFMNEDVRSKEQKTWEKKHLKTLRFADIDEDMNQGEIARYRQELGLRKVPWVVDYVKDRLKNKNESLLLFAWHREVCAKLAEGLSQFNPGVVIGGTKASDREGIFHDFTEGCRRLIIGNIAAMGRGHNLQRADRVVFAEYSWTDELNMQCEKRAARRGREESKTVRCDYIVSPGSMDEPVLNSLFTKQARVRKVIG